MNVVKKGVIMNEKNLKVTIWENLQLLTLMGSICGQITIGMSFLLGQGLFLAANIVALTRNFVLHRPVADKVKDGCLTALTLGLIIAYLLGAYN